VSDWAGLSGEHTKAGRLQRAVLELILEHEQADQIPTSTRFLFYELEQRGIVSKVKTGARRPDQDLSDAVTRLSEVGLVPWDWIVDESRSVHSWGSAKTIKDYLADRIEITRLDPWADAVRPIVITEARTAGGVFSRTLGPEYVVPIMPTNGQTKRFLINEVVPFLNERDSIVLYVGDYDLAGNQIEDNTRRVLERHADRPFRWTRVAITGDQAGTLRVKGIDPIIKHDHRYTDGREHEAYEAEALGQGELTRIVRIALDSILPEPLDHVLEREKLEREQMTERLANIE
jgi:hypothetical protein